MATDVNGVVIGARPPGIPHLRIPFTVGPTGAAETVQQGSADEITQSVANLIGTRPGTRLVVPTYGVPDPTFAGVTPSGVRLAVGRWEKRATVTLSATPGSNEQATVLVRPAQGATS